MFRVKKFLSLTAVVIGGVMGAGLLTYFSFAQNYELLGGADLVNQVLQFIMPKHDVYLYARTAPNIFTISFDGNGATLGTMENMSGVVYDQGTDLLANNFERDGFTFAGWSRSVDGPVEYADQDNAGKIPGTHHGTVTLYAQRTEVQVPYTVEYLLENLDGTYDSAGTGTEYGPAGTGVIMTGKTFEGFTLSGETIYIVSGGTAQYHYTRNTYHLIVKDRETPLIDTGIKYEAPIPLPPDPVWDGNKFSGWSNLPADGRMPAHDLDIESIWRTVYSITFNTHGGTEVTTITGTFGDPIPIPPNPTREGYEFVKWSPDIPSTFPNHNMMINAVWNKIKGGGGWSGGGGRRSSSDDSEGEGEHGSAVDQSPSGNRDSLEVLIAYMWANSRGIIDKARKDSDPDGYVTRGDMAEMLVKFTENVLKEKIPAVPANCTWGDSEREWYSTETKVYAEKACALGVMGIRMQNFMPNKILDRAEFGTILSRLLWGDKYDVVDATSTNLYYTRHLAALKREKVMTQIDNPEARKELRKWAWLMLMRIESKKIK